MLDVMLDDFSQFSGHCGMLEEFSWYDRDLTVTKTPLAAVSHIEAKTSRRPIFQKSPNILTLYIY